jgi:hypothetical protein
LGWEADDFTLPSAVDYRFFDMDSVQEACLRKVNDAFRGRVDIIAALEMLATNNWNVELVIAHFKEKQRLARETASNLSVAIDHQIAGSSDPPPPQVNFSSTFDLIDLSAM